MEKTLRVPADVMTELIRHDAIMAWESLAPSRQRAHLDDISSATRARARSERIARAVDKVRRETIADF